MRPIIDTLNSRLRAYHRRLLRNYDGVGFADRYRANFQLVTFLITILALSTVILEDRIVGGFWRDSVVLLQIPGLFLTVVLVYLLHRGYVRYTGHAYLFMIAGVIWGDTLFRPAQRLESLMDNAYLAIAVQFTVPMFCGRAGIVLHNSLALLLFVVFLNMRPEFAALPPGVHVSYALNTGLSMLLVAMLSLLFVRTIERSREITEESNRILEEQVLMQTEELSVALDEVRQTNEHLSEINRELEENRLEMEYELRIAARVQQQVLPSAAPAQLNGWQAAVHTTSLETGGEDDPRISGTVMDFFARREELEGVYLFDCGTDTVSSGIATLLIRAAMFRGHRNRRHEHPRRVLETVYAEIRTDLTFADGEFSGNFVRFGPGDTMRRAGSGDEGLLLRRGDGTIEVPHGDESVSLRAGDALLLYSPAQFPGPALAAPPARALRQVGGLRPAAKLLSAMLAEPPLAQKIHRDREPLLILLVKT